jgi:predicted metalloendopeptidase
MRIASRILLTLVTAMGFAFLPAAASAQAPRRSGIDTAGFDRSVRPQDDFYAFVNGGWLATHPIPDDADRWGVFEVLGEQSREAIRRILEDAVRSNAPNGSDEQKIGDLYASFLDSARVESLGVAPLKGELDRIAAIRSASELPAAFARMVRLGQYGTVVGAVRVRPDAKASSRNAVYVEPTGLPRDFFLGNSARTDSIRRGYARVADRLLSLAPGHGSAGAGERLLAIRMALARAQWDAARARDPNASYNSMTVAQLVASTPHFDWKAYLDAAGLGAAERVIVTQPDYFATVDSLISHTPISTWREWLAVGLLGLYAEQLSAPFTEASFDFYGKLLSGQQVELARSKRAALQVEIWLGDAVGRMYVARHFRPSAKARVDSLVRNLRDAYRVGIDSLEWMTPETKTEARNKLARITVKIGFPDEWRDYSAVAIRRDDLLGNVMRARAHAYDDMVAQLGKPVDRLRWLYDFTPQTVGAYYADRNNEMAFPAAILQAPFFDPDVDDAVNYGAIGAVIGHEIGHAFDDESRKSDGEGNLRDWWTAADASAFEARAAKLGAQFDVLSPLEGVHVNGKLTMGENIGDLSGIAQAYRAYRSSLHGKEPPVIEGLTGDQRFFIGYAQSRRTKYREAALRQSLLSDNHAPARYRVIVPLMNNDAFQRAFDVKPGDGMYLAPDQRVHIW